MTLVYEQARPGAATHAFVIGAGAYPEAKPGRGKKGYLRQVQDLPSAADSAKFFCDWLQANADRLAMPLGSIELLLSDPAGGAHRYVPQVPVAADAATTANVLIAGDAWWNRLQPGDTALFYCCGHGARHNTQPVLLLQDLNEFAKNPWANLNLQDLARSLQQHPTLGSAVMFADSCGEINARLELSKSPGAAFYPEYDLFERAFDKVLLVAAASSGQLTHEGSFANTHYPVDARVKMGRFTQILIRALDGASTRWKGGRWTVDSGNLHLDLKPLWRSFYPEWSGKDFEPSSVVTPNDRYAIIHPHEPKVPIQIVTLPDTRMLEFDLLISKTANPADDALLRRERPENRPWVVEVPAMREGGLFALANAHPTCHSCWFIPDEPIFDIEVEIP